MHNAQKPSKMAAILINHADNWFVRDHLKPTDLAGRGFKIADAVRVYSNGGCNKLYYSYLVPGITVIHAPKGYLSFLKLLYGRSLRPRRATRALIEEAILTNAERFDIPVYAEEIEDEVEDMLAPAPDSEGIAIYCADEVYAEFIATTASQSAVTLSPPSCQAA